MYTLTIEGKDLRLIQPKLTLVQAYNNLLRHAARLPITEATIKRPNGSPCLIAQAGSSWFVRSPKSPVCSL
jgi:hypothetical protein